MANEGSMSVKEIVRVASQIADGLAAAHRQGLVHRDIKPASVLMENDVSRVMITDFGLARAVDEIAMTQSGCLAGTLHYMFPEQVTDGAVDHRSDLFSLGGLMYFLATGHEPFRGENAFAVINKVVGAAPPSVRQFTAEIPETLDRIIDRLLERDPDDRIQSAQQLHELLTQYLAHLQAPELHLPPTVGLPYSSHRQARKRVAGFAVLVAVGLVCFFALDGRFPSGSQGDSDKATPAGEQEHHDKEQHHGEHEHSDLPGEMRQRADGEERRESHNTEHH